MLSAHLSACRSRLGLCWATGPWGEQGLGQPGPLPGRGPSGLSGDTGAGQGEVSGRASWLSVPWSSPSESGWVGAVAAAFLAGSPEESFVITT